MVSSKKNSLSVYGGKRIVVTGGGGYLATGLVHELSRVKCRIVRLYRNGGTVPPPFPAAQAQIEDICGNITDSSIWTELLEGADFVFHFAAQTSVYVADEDPYADMQVNFMPAFCMLEECRHKKYRPNIIFAGTATECGIPGIMAANENHPDNPVTVYDVHKLMAEKYLLCYARNGIVKGASLRLSNVYGPGPLSGSPDRGVLNRMVRKALKGETLTIYGNGENIRDYIYIDDVIKAFLSAGENMDSVNGNYYIIGSGMGFSIAQMVNLVSERAARKTGKKTGIISIPPPPGQSLVESRNFTADTSCFTEKTKWTPSVSLTEGIDRTIEYFLSRGEEWL